MPQLCPKQIFLLFYTFFQYSKSKILTLSRTGLEAYYQNAESLYFKGFQRILPHRRRPKVLALILSISIEVNSNHFKIAIQSQI